MKKITLIVFIFFLGVVVSIFGYGFLFNANNYSVQNTNYTTPKSDVIVNKTTDKKTDKITGTTTTQNNIPTSLTIEEVAKHSTKNDCYLIIKNKVYSVSSYIDSHPGGVNKITSNCGTEVSGIFASIHSNFAWDLLKKYYIGDLK